MRVSTNRFPVSSRKRFQRHTIFITFIITLLCLKIAINIRFLWLPWKEEISATEARAAAEALSRRKIDLKDSSQDHYVKVVDYTFDHHDDTDDDLYVPQGEYSWRPTHHDPVSSKRRTRTNNTYNNNNNNNKPRRRRRSTTTPPPPRVLLYLTTHMSSLHRAYLHSCWPPALSHSLLLRQADVLVYLNPDGLVRRSALELLRTTFAGQHLTVQVRTPQQKQRGAMDALSTAVRERWFAGYDWVLRVNPDVIVRNDTFLTDVIMSERRQEQRDRRQQQPQQQQERERRRQEQEEKNKKRARTKTTTHPHKREDRPSSKSKKHVTTAALLVDCYQNRVGFQGPDYWKFHTDFFMIQPKAFGLSGEDAEEEDGTPPPTDGGGAAFLRPKYDNAENSFTSDVIQWLFGQNVTRLGRIVGNGRRLKGDGPYRFRLIPGADPMSWNCRVGDNKTLVETPITHFHDDRYEIRKDRICPIPFVV